MAIEGHRTGIFNTLALPPLHESYRNLILHQLYQKFDTTAFRSICWSTPESGMSRDKRSDIIVLPGEERYVMESLGISFSNLRRKAYSCPYHKEETNVEVDEGTVKTSQTHFCTLPISNRPLMCRALPFGIARTNDNRKFHIMADMKGFSILRRRSGSIIADQIMHGVIQIAISMWPFLTDEWWSYYEKAYGSNWKFESLGEVGFTLNDDTIISNIKGAPSVWRTEILGQISNPECLECEGTGIEFWDHLPVPQRRFDLCRKCVLLSIGASFNGVLVDPSNRKILMADGSSYRGDRLSKDDV